MNPLFIAIILLIILIIWIYKINKEGFEEKEVIPRNVFQTTKELLPKMKEYRDRLMRDNPEFNYVLMNDEECREFIVKYFDQRTVNAYDKLIPGAYKADLWRYCVLYIHGGIYIDNKFYTVNDFKLIQLLDQEHYVKDIDFHFESGSIGIYNAFLVQRKGSICMKKCIEKTVENIENEVFGYNPLYPTGPGMMGQVYATLEDKGIMDMEKVGEGTILQNGKEIIKTYDEYRSESNNSPGKPTHYDTLWHAHTIYKSA